MRLGQLGRIYSDGELIIREGDAGDCMFVMQSGTAEVVTDGPDGDIRLSVLHPGDVFGEMSLFTRSPRSTTVRALGEVRVLTLDKRGFMKRVHEDPSLALQILERMSERIAGLNRKLVEATERHRSDEVQV